MKTMADIAERVKSLLDEKVEEAARKRATHLEVLAQAFLDEVGVPPSEVELVEQSDGNGVRWFFRRRTP